VFLVFRQRGFTFFFYSNEGMLRESAHIHVGKDDLEAKFWLRPEVRVAYNDGYDARALRDLLEIVEDNRERIERRGMSSSAKATRVSFDDDDMWVELGDGRTIGVPLAWVPGLLRATPEQRQQVRISSRGLHWETLDEDVSVPGLLAGLGDQTTGDRTFAA
jgi:hypothetical protein